MIVARHLYHSLPGKSADVLKQRQPACDVREKLGLQRGRVLVRVRGGDERAEIVWEWDYAEVAAYDQEIRIQRASEEFVAVRRHQRTLIERMDVVLFKVVEPS